MTTLRKFAITAAAALLLLAGTAKAEAAVILLEINTFIQDNQVLGDPTVATLRFEDVVGGVELTISSSLNGATEKIGDIAFNIDPAITPSSVTATFQSQIGTFSLPTFVK